MCAKAREMDMYGKAWTKLVVPSMGSQMNVGAGVRSAEVGVGDDSSPRNLWASVEIASLLDGETYL